MDDGPRDKILWDSGAGVHTACLHHDGHLGQEKDQADVTEL